MSQKESFMRQRFTGERLTYDLLHPTPRGLLQIRKELGSSPFGLIEIAKSHVQRYIFAERIISENQGDTPPRVLDIASGVGYGSSILSTGNRIVTAVDLHGPSVREALHIYPSINSGVVADGQHLPFNDASFDFAVSFETFEHVPDPNLFLAELSRVIKPSGQVILSTPNRDVTNPGAYVTDKPHNGFHEFEMNLQEFSESLQAVFPDVKLFGQNQITTHDSLLRRRALSIGVPGRIAVRMHDLASINTRSSVGPLMEGDIPTYMVAVCSKG
jgi:SAM-dependent methyltransferase